MFYIKKNIIVSGDGILGKLTKNAKAHYQYK